LNVDYKIDQSDIIELCAKIHEYALDEIALIRSIKEDPEKVKGLGGKLMKMHDKRNDIWKKIFKQ